MAAAKDAGFFDAHLVKDPPEAFFEVGSCLCFPRQAQLDPVKLLKGLCEKVSQRGGKIFVQSKVEKFFGGLAAFVETAEGFRASCNSIVVATNVPTNDWMHVHIKEAASSILCDGHPFTASEE